MSTSIEKKESKDATKVDIHALATPVTPPASDTALNNTSPPVVPPVSPTAPPPENISQNVHPSLIVPPTQQYMPQYATPGVPGVPANNYPGILYQLPMQPIAAQASFQRNILPPVSVEIFSAAQNSSNTVYAFKDQVLAVAAMPGCDANLVRQRLPFWLSGNALTYYKKLILEHSDYDLSQILEAMVVEFAPKMHEFSLRREILRRVQQPGESVFTYFYTLLELNERLKLATGEGMSDAILAQTLLQGLEDRLRPFVFSQLAAQLGPKMASATSAQVRNTAEAAEALVNIGSNQHQRAATSKGFPAQVINEITDIPPQITNTYLYDMQALRAEVNELRNLAERGFQPKSSPVPEIPAKPAAANDARDQRGAHLDRDHPPDSEQRRPFYRNRGRNDGPRPEKPNSDCHTCKLAGVQGDIKHWHNQCPLIQAAVRQYKDANQPPPPPHVPAATAQEKGKQNANTLN